MGLSIKVPSRAAELLLKEARSRGLHIQDIVLEKLEADLDPKDKAQDYMEVSLLLLNEAKQELDKGDLRQASEKIWGAAALAIKAHAYWNRGIRLSSHSELWEYKEELVKAFGNWVRDSWTAAVHMHINFYEGWATKNDVKDAYEKVSRLIKEIRKEIKPETR